ncbi:hypothetical protein N7475_000651 [Penicillium sp. IBT 31633x]|nr:hypothetical protein N7475_000651 [Penicillium sp. IBT 31633x]
MTSTKAPLAGRQTRESADTITTLPMSSQFTPPASCADSWTYEPSGANLIANGLLLQNAVDNDGADPDCFPSGYSQYGRVQPSIVYSPGYCPDGYISADIVVHNPVTTAMCCPSGFEYYTESRDSDTTFAGCTSGFASGDTTLVTVRQVSDESTQVTGPVTMWAQPIQIQLEAKDSSLFVTSSPTTTATTTTTTATGDTPPGATPSPSAPTQPSPSTPPGAPTNTATAGSSGLSTGASIGIGVGVGMAGVIVIAGLAFWLFRRHRAKKKLGSNADSSYQHPEASEIDGSPFDTSISTPGPGNTEPSEYGGVSSQAGTDSILANSRTTYLSELDGGSSGRKFVHELHA